MQRQSGLDAAVFLFGYVYIVVYGMTMEELPSLFRFIVGNTLRLSNVVIL